MFGDDEGGKENKQHHMIEKINISLDDQIDLHCNKSKHDHTTLNFTAIMCFNLTEHKYYVYS